MLKNICWCLVLTPSYSTADGSSSDRTTLLTTTFQDKKLSELPAYKALLNTFITQEIIPWGSFQSSYAAEIQGQPDIFGGENKGGVSCQRTERSMGCKACLSRGCYALPSILWP